MDDVHQYMPCMNLHGTQHGSNTTSEGLLEVLTPRSSCLDVGSSDACHLTLLLQALEIEHLPNDLHDILGPDAPNPTGTGTPDSPPVMLPSEEARVEGVDREVAAGESSAACVQYSPSHLESTPASVARVLPPSAQGYNGDRADDAAHAASPWYSGSDVGGLAGRGGSDRGWLYMELDIDESEVHLGEFPLLVNSHSQY